MDDLENKPLDDMTLAELVETAEWTSEEHPGVFADALWSIVRDIAQAEGDNSAFLKAEYHLRHLKEEEAAAVRIDEQLFEGDQQRFVVALNQNVGYLRIMDWAEITKEEIDVSNLEEACQKFNRHAEKCGIPQRIICYADRFEVYLSGYRGGKRSHTYGS